jgi:hypothetical protein
MATCNFKNCHSEAEYYCAECPAGYCARHGN